MKIRRAIKSLIDLVPFRDRQTRRRELAVLLLAILVMLFIETFRRDPNLATSMMALGTLLLAFVTWWSIQTSREKEMRNRKELLLDRIREWAENIRIVGLERDIEPLRVGAGGSGHSVLSQMLNTFRMLQRKGQYISGITLTTWSTLHTLVENMRSELHVQIEALSKYDEHVSQTNFETVQKHRDVVNKIADNIIDEVSRIQTVE